MESTTTTIAMDVAKSVFEVAVSTRAGKVARRHRLTRAEVTDFFTEQAPATVLMEGCGSAHHWARELRGLGHEVVLLPPHQVRPYVPANKTDRADAKGLLEAFRNEAIRSIPVKSPEQQAVLGLHRVRAAWMRTRTARLNGLRGMLREFGIFIPLGASRVVPAVREELDKSEGVLPPILRPALREAIAEIGTLEERVHALEQQLKRLAAVSPEVRRLMTIPGIGCLGATALIALVGDARRFPSGRHFASYLGLTPKEHSSGSVRRLGRISKRGDSYLRMLLLSGARSVLIAARRRAHPGPLLSWALHLQQTRGTNKAAIALANKLARIVWAVWRSQGEYVARRGPAGASQA